MYVKCKKLEFAQRLFDALVERDIISWNTTIAGYAKVGELDLAHTFFDQMPRRYPFSWSSLIYGYSQRSDYIMVMSLFSSMVVNNVMQDNVTMAILVHAAAEIGGLDRGKLIHSQVVVGICGIFIDK